MFNYVINKIFPPWVFKKKKKKKNIMSMFGVAIKVDKKFKLISIINFNYIFYGIYDFYQLFNYRFINFYQKLLKI